MEKTHWKKAFNSDYLSSADVEDKDLVLTIEKVSLTEVKGTDGQSKTCNVATFKEKSKPMILNVTNSKIVKKFSGSRYIEDWINIPVQIYVDEKVRAFGDVVEGLRIRKEQPQIGKKELLPNTDQWKKAVAHLKAKKPLEQITKHYSIKENDLKELLKQVEAVNEAS